MTHLASISSCCNHKFTKKLRVLIEYLDICIQKQDILPYSLLGLKRYFKKSSFIKPPETLGIDLGWGLSKSKNAPS